MALMVGISGGAALRGRHRIVLAGTEARPTHTEARPTHTEARPTHYVDVHPCG